MAYRNSDGVITIDEDVALDDVRKMEEVRQTLKRAAQRMRELISEAQGYDGETIHAIIDKATEKLRKIEKLIRSLEEAQSYTKRVVAHYQLVDQECKKKLENSANGK